MQAPSGLVVKYEIIQASIEIGVKLIEKKTEGMLWISSNPDVPRIELIIEVGLLEVNLQMKKTIATKNANAMPKRELPIKVELLNSCLISFLQIALAGEEEVRFS